MANPKCPRCGSTHTAKILYGMSVFSEKLEKELDAGEVVLGGCVVHEHQPRFRVMLVKKLLELLRSPKMAQSLFGRSR